MEFIINDAEKIVVEGSTVDFYKQILDGTSYYYFDTSKCGPPEPMVNAMAGLQLLDENSKLLMMNHKPPMGLFPKIQKNFSYEIEELSNGYHQITFSTKTGSKQETDFTQNSCAG
jgi:hypothetical protein